MSSTTAIRILVMALLVLLGGSPSAASSGSGSTAAAPLPARLAWGWPLDGRPQVVHAFDPPAKPWLSGHRGVDLVAAQGAPVLAPEAGVVTFSGVVVERSVLVIAVEGGLRISLEPVVSELHAGDAVTKGQRIGTLEGPTHCDGTGTSCLHWGVRRGEEYLNPLQFVLDLRPSVLLPIDP